MKNKAIKFFAIFSLCVLCLGWYTMRQISSDVPTAKGLPIDYLLGNFVVDVNNPYEVVGFADYYFLAKVDKVVATSYRDEEPYTDYSVEVLRNIKGILPENEPILLTKAGGISQDGKSVVLYEDDMMLESGKTYAITASVQKDGTLLVSGPNSCEVIENTVNTIDSGMDEYDSYYTNEIVYDRERFECIYSK